MGQSLQVETQTYPPLPKTCSASATRVMARWQSWGQRGLGSKCRYRFCCWPSPRESGCGNSWISAKRTVWLSTACLLMFTHWWGRGCEPPGQWTWADAIRKALLYSSGDVRDSGCTSQTKATLPMPGSVHCTKSALLHQLTKGVHGHVASVPARVDFRRDSMTSSLL